MQRRRREEKGRGIIKNIYIIFITNTRSDMERGRGGEGEEERRRGEVRRRSLPFRITYNRSNIIHTQRERERERDCYHLHSVCWF